MLKLSWSHGLICAPEAKRYSRANDKLGHYEGDSIQKFARNKTEFAAPNLTLDDVITQWQQNRKDANTPCTIMVHGFDYDPTNHLGGGADDPFKLVYGVPGTGTPPLDYHRSWLPIVGEYDDNGQHKAETAIAFSWVSEGSLSDYAAACWDNDYKLAALDLAPLAAKALAAVMACVSKQGTIFNVLSHSLGTRVVSEAVGLMRKAGVVSSARRMVFLGGAEFSVDAAQNFDGCAFDVVNIASRVDRVLELGAETMCHPVRPNGSLASAVIGREGLGANPRWLDLQLDHKPLVDWCRRGSAPTGTNYHIAAAALTPTHILAGLNHWSYYTNDGNRQFVTDVLDRADMDVTTMRSAQVPSGVESQSYGLFNGATIPETPKNCDDRSPYASLDRQPQ